MTALAQDFIWLGGFKSPGLCTLGPASSPRKWEERAGYGLSGAWLFYTGDGLASFEATFYLWTLEHDAQWKDFAEKVLSKPKRGTRPSALSISHPILELPPHVITSVVIEDVSSIEIDETGGRSARVKFKQFRAPLPLLGKPNRTIGKPDQKEPTAKNELEEAIVRAKAEFKKVASQ